MNRFLTLKNIGYDSYQEYLGSFHWLEIVKKIKEKLNNKCEVHGCNKTDKLEVHHINYNNLGNESFRDLVLICKKHHEEAHKTRNENLKKTIKRYIEWEQ